MDRTNPYEYFYRGVFKCQKVRFCVQRIGDVNVLYYWEKGTGDSKRRSLRVVTVEDLWETLMGDTSRCVMEDGPEWRNTW